MVSTVKHPLELSGLRKQYGSHAVLRDLSLRVEAGELVLLLGPNGAGKSTLLSCVAGTTVPDEGKIRIDGYELQSQPLLARRSLRYLPQEVDVPEGLTGDELLRFYAQLFGANSSDYAAMCKFADLGRSLDHLATTYSVGMRRRLVTAGLTAGNGALYVLDEPMAGLDRNARIRLVDWLCARQRAGAGILIAAHDQDREELEVLGPREFAL